jgi:hypothetical protein
MVEVGGASELCDPLVHGDRSHRRRARDDSCQPTPPCMTPGSAGRGAVAGRQPGQAGRRQPATDRIEDIQTCSIGQVPDRPVNRGIVSCLSSSLSIPQLRR